MQMRIVILLSLIIFGLESWAQDSSKVQLGTDGVAKISFEETEHKFGEIMIGTKARHEFKFTNTGDAPLILTNVTTSCGCTVPDWPRHPIAPGQTEVIKVLFNSENRPGSFNKSITVKHNGEGGLDYLIIRGYVKTH